MRKSVINKSNIIKYLLLLKIAMFVIVDSVITYGCYRQPESSCSHHNLTCPDDEVIAVNEIIDNANIAYGRKKPGLKCPQDQMGICNATCCRYQGNNEDVDGLIQVNLTERLSVYRHCSNQQTCTVTSPYSNDTDYDYIRYAYICLPVALMYNMMEITDVSFLYNGYLYYSGKTQTTGKKLTRCCNITSTEPILVESIYIDLAEESSYNVKIYSGNRSLLRCIDDGGIFYGYKELSMSGATIYHVVLDNLTVEEDDYIWIFIQSNSNISITCDDCAGFTASAPQIDECLSETGCYEQPRSPYSTQTLTCDGGQVISIDERNEKRKIHYGTKFNPSCNPSLDTASCDNKKCCRRNIADKHSPVDRDDRLQVYKNCSNKLTCNLTSPYTPGARYNYIYYPYICIPDNLVYDIINIDGTTLPDEAYLYISNQQPYNGTLSCSLTSLQTVRIESVFINLSLKSCSKIQIFSRNQDLLNCSTDVISLGPELKVSGENITVQIEDFTDEGDSVMWIKVYGGPSISCTRYLPPSLESGCYGEPGSSCSTYALNCDEGQVISIDERNEKRKIHYGTKSNPSCNASLDTTSCDNKKCCRRNIADKHSPVDRDDRLQVYKNCSNKRTCNLTSPYTPGARYNYIYYPYICIPDNLTFDIVNIDSTKLPDEAYLYISNQQAYSGNLSCTLTSLQTVRIESVFITLNVKSCSKIQIFSLNEDLLNCSTDVISLGPELNVSGENITVQIEDITDGGENVMWIKVSGGPSIGCTRYLPPSPVPGTVQGSSDQLGLIVGCVVGVMVFILVVVVVYCIIRRRRNKLGDNRQELECTTKNNRRESEYDTIHDDDTNKRESFYHTIDDRFLQNSTKDGKSAGGPSSNTPSNEKLTYQVIDRDFSAKSSNIATPKENLTCQGIDHATFPNTASPKHDTNYTVIDHDFTSKASQSRAPEEETGYTYIGHDFGTKAAKLPSTQSPKDKTDYTYLDHDFSSDSIGPVGSPLNKASPNQESNYHIIDDDFSVKPKPGSGCCDLWESRLTLEPRSGLSTPPLDSKGKYSVVKPKNLRRQGEGKPSEYDHICTKTTAVDLGKGELLDPNYYHFKHTSLIPVVNENTYYDHIPRGDEDPLSDPYNDPTYDHLGEKGQTTKPQHDIARNMNSTSSSQFQPRKSKTNVDDPTYNHLVEKGSTTKPQQGNTVFPNPAFHGENKDVDDPFIDPTYNHLGENSHALQQDNSENVDHPNNDDTYNHLGAKVHTPQPEEGNHNTKNVDGPNNNDTYNHLGAKGHTPQPQEHSSHQTSDSQWRADDPTYNHLGDDKPESQKH